MQAQVRIHSVHCAVLPEAQPNVPQTPHTINPLQGAQARWSRANTLAKITQSHTHTPGDAYNNALQLPCCAATRPSTQATGKARMRAAHDPKLELDRHTGTPHQPRVPTRLCRHPYTHLSCRHAMLNDDSCAHNHLQLLAYSNRPRAQTPQPSVYTVIASTFCATTTTVCFTAAAAPHSHGADVQGRGADGGVDSGGSAAPAWHSRQLQHRRRPSHSCCPCGGCRADSPVCTLLPPAAPRRIHQQLQQQQLPCLHGSLVARTVREDILTNPSLHQPGWNRRYVSTCQACAGFLTPPKNARAITTHTAQRDRPNA